MSLQHLIDTDGLTTFGQGTIVPLKGEVGKFIGDIAPVENSPATAAHAIGDYIMYGGELYKVKTVISIGDTLIVNTNIEAVTVAEALENAGTAISVDDALSPTSENPVQNKVVTAALLDIFSVALPVQNGTLTYNGSSQTPVWTGYDSLKMTIGGVTSGTNAGEYTATFTPIAPYLWSDGTRVAKNVGWSIGKATITLPSQSGTLTYSGSSQSPTWTGYDSNKMTIGGTTSGTNAGDYTATFTPKSNYMWSDTTTAAKNAVWSIGRAIGTLTLSKTSVSTMKDQSTTVTITTNSDGTKSVSSSNTSYVTASVSGNTVTLTGGSSSGSATVTVSIAQSTNYTAVSETISVTNSAYSTTLANNTPAQIKSAAQAGLAPSLWSVGDKTSAITLNGTVGALTFSNETVYAFILGFNHNASIEGSNSIHFGLGMTSGGTKIAFVDSSYGRSDVYAMFHMNSYSTNSGGWSSSSMRYTICPAFKNALPSAWRSVIKATTKYSDNTGGGSDTASYVTSTSDEIFLLSEYEVFRTRTYANSAEQNYQAQYAYFANGNSRIFTKHSAISTACKWWLRSVYAAGDSHICIVNTDGSANAHTANTSLGFVPCFKVA